MLQFNFKPIHLGQTIIKYHTPHNIFQSIQSSIINNQSKLLKANKQLAGKIKDEFSLFHIGSTELEQHNVLDKEVIDWFLMMFKHYLSFNKIEKYEMSIHSIWINEMKENEYNPIHIHMGRSKIGLSSVMILKLPSSYGVEYSAENHPSNGKLELISNDAGQFSNTSHRPELKEGDFFIFPYDVKHCVYPFNSTKETRITLSANCDILQIGLS